MKRTSVRNRALCFGILLLMPLLPAADDPAEQARKDIIAAYQQSLDALRRGDAEAAMQIDTNDWVSITVGQRPRTRQEMEPFIRRDIASMKPPPDWLVLWRPDYPPNVTSSGIQIYDLKLERNSAIVLYLIGNTRTETIGGIKRQVWSGSHIRDTWTNTASGWKRRMHEK